MFLMAAMNELLHGALVLCTLLLATTSVVGGVRCHSCRGIRSLSQCTNFTSCPSSQQCFVEEVAGDDMQILFNMGCETHKACDERHLNTHVIGRREASRDRRSIIPCFKCCNEDLCNVDNCAALCRHNPCQNGGTCSSDRTESYHACACKPGYTGRLCEYDIDDCASGPCHNGALCMDHVNGFSCSCPSGFAGRTCQTKTSSTVCLQCDGVDDPSHCTASTICGVGEKCFTDAVLSSEIVSFKMGCRPERVCTFYENLLREQHSIRRRSHEITQCSHCCSSDFCNSDICAAVQHFSSCADYLRNGYSASGVYQLYLTACGKTSYVYCDMESREGPWTVIQRRRDGSVDFFRTWKEYKNGFGNLKGEFWLGNDVIHCLTQTGLNILQITMGSWTMDAAVANYSYFSVGDAASNYTLHVDDYSGTAGDGLGSGNGTKFTTKDADHDGWPGNCARANSHHGAWWYPSDCGLVNLNGVYGKQGDTGPEFLTWYPWTLSNDTLRFAQMKLK